MRQTHNKSNVSASVGSDSLERFSPTSNHFFKHFSVIGAMNIFTLSDLYDRVKGETSCSVVYNSSQLK